MAEAEPSSVRPRPRTRPGLEELAVDVHRAQQQPPVLVAPVLEVEEEEEEEEDGDDNANADNVNDDDGGENGFDGGNANDTEETQTVTTPSESSSTARPKLTKAESRAMKKAAKAAKSQSKAFKNQAKHAISVRSEDVEFVATVLHGDKNAATAAAAANHPLATDKNIEEVIARNMGFMSNIQAHKHTLLQSITQRRKADREQQRRRSAAAAISTNNCHNSNFKKLRCSAGGGHDDFDGLDEETEYLLAAVLTKLGVDAARIKTGGGGASSAARRGGNNKNWGSSAAGSGGANVNANLSAIVANLKTLVKDDLERHENELRETCIRAGGFWRWVGKPVFDRMTQIARELDWKTGVKIH